MIPFVHPSLFWIGLPLLALPILIHLINLLRQRKVDWAAMEFLLVSQKKHRKWIILKQLLLLLARIAAVAALVLMVAQPVLKDQWGKIFGGSNQPRLKIERVISAAAPEVGTISPETVAQLKKVLTLKPKATKPVLADALAAANALLEGQVPRLLKAGLA